VELPWPSICGNGFMHNCVNCFLGWVLISLRRGGMYVRLLCETVEQHTTEGALLRSC
jgi:hypothetical protein